MNSSSRGYSYITGRPVAMVRGAATTSMSTSCLPSHPVANINAVVRRQVAGRGGFGKIDIFRLIVQDGRAGLHRLCRVKQLGQQLVLYVDQVELLLGDL